MSTPPSLPPRHLATIKLKPSIELLIDEYERQTNKHFVVQIIYGKDHAVGAKEFSDMMTSCGFTVKMDPFKEVDKILQSLKSHIEKQRVSAGVFIIVLCEGSAEESAAGMLFDDNDKRIPFDSVWDIFLKIDALNQQPKIFLFQTQLPPIRMRRDSLQSDGPPPRRLYDVAAPGADMLLISRSFRKGSDDYFISSFCKNVKDYGHYADIFEIATFSTEVDRPLIVSTFTAKFFFKNATKGTDEKPRHYNYLIQKGLKDILGETKNKSFKKCK